MAGAVNTVMRLSPRFLKVAMKDAMIALPRGHALLRRYSRGFPTYVISYPKCGRTWLRLVLGRVLQDHYQLHLEQKADLLETHRLSEIDPRVPYVRFTHDDKPFLLKRAQELERDKTRYGNKIVIFLSRDPRDVVVSNYFQMAIREVVLKDSPPFRGSLKEFLQDETYGIRNIVAFMNIWASNRHVPKRFMLVRYEDLADDMEREIWRVLRFIGVNSVNPAVVSEAVKFGSFDNMKRLEREDILGSPRLKAIERDDPDSGKVRRGKVGGYVDYLDPGDIEYVNSAIEELDNFFGYQ
jgi:hypothetical protein